MKIIINTTESYKKPFSLLMKSIIDSGFTEFDNLIISYAEAESNVAPVIESLGNLIDSDIPYDYDVVVVKSVLKNYDYAGYNALWLHRKNPLIKADSYFYLLDTTTVESNFFKKINSFKVKPGQIITVPTPNANIVIFHNNIIDLYRDSYNRNLTKTQAVDLECARIINIDGKSITGLLFYADIRIIKPRVMKGVTDIYNTGHKRLAFYYPDFGVYKYVLWDRDGDIKNNLVYIVDNPDISELEKKFDKWDEFVP